MWKIVAALCHLRMMRRNWHLGRRMSLWAQQTAPEAQNEHMGADLADSAIKKLLLHQERGYTIWE
ncbi:hypothetical protein L195_g036364 [Trifolium pratense]|uniref:Uncharacterized protein n=1 Tax=Trifolium pratense TaxID=57577 RepID=A0A2K3LP97_TRIPR|nr:hypothetical protein L195_g036364 [Trifolium pratense]